MKLYLSHTYLLTLKEYEELKILMKVPYTVFSVVLNSRFY